MLRDQGSFAEARAAYESTVEVDKKLGDERGQGVVLGQLGTLALLQRDYTEAARRYREALALHEQQSDSARVAVTCNQLAIVAMGAGRPAEAEGWYGRALANFERAGHLAYIAGSCNNLASLLLAEVRAGRTAPARLAEARSYAERALAIRETMEASSEIWSTLSILVDIAELEGRAEEASALRRREREAFAAFAGNRWHIDQQHSALIAAVVAAARGDDRRRGRRWRSACRS